MARFPYKKARSVVAGTVFAAVVAGLFLGNGWGTLSSMGYDAVAYLCPVGALETLAAQKAMVPRALVALAVAVVAIALLGRAFCAWVCPVPPIQRFFHPASKGDAAGEVAESGAGEAGAGEVGTRHCAGCGGSCVGGKRDGLHLDSRHGVLLGALASSAVFGFPVFCLVCPIGLSIALVIAVYRAVFQQSPTLALLAFAAILLVELVFFRKWCHRLCPMGAFMSLVGAKAPVGKPHVDPDACLRMRGIDCRVCVGACPEELDPHSGAIPECTRCGECAQKCPAHAIALGLPGRQGETGNPES